MKTGRKFPVVIASILRERMVVLGLAVISILHVVLTFLGLPGWECPLLQTTGIPCPGCGLSRSMVLFLTGKWKESLALHLFGPFFLFLIVSTGIIAVLPSRYRTSVVNKIQVIEERTGVSAVFLISLILYWCLRMLLAPAAFIRLINNT